MHAGNRGAQQRNCIATEVLYHGTRGTRCFAAAPAPAAQQLREGGLQVLKHALELQAQEEEAAQSESSMMIKLSAELAAAGPCLQWLQ